MKHLQNLLGQNVNLNKWQIFYRDILWQETNSIIDKQKDSQAPITVLNLIITSLNLWTKKKPQLKLEYIKQEQWKEEWLHYEDVSSFELS